MTYDTPNEISSLCQSTYCCSDLWQYWKHNCFASILENPISEPRVEKLRSCFWGKGILSLVSKIPNDSSNIGILVRSWVTSSLLENFDSSSLFIKRFKKSTQQHAVPLHLRSDYATIVMVRICATWLMPLCKPWRPEPRVLPGEAYNTGAHFWTLAVRMLWGAH